MTKFTYNVPKIPAPANPKRTGTTTRAVPLVGKSLILIPGTSNPMPASVKIVLLTSSVICAERRSLGMVKESLGSRKPIQ